MKIACFEVTFLYLVVQSASFPVEYDDDDDSAHLSHIYNTGSPLYHDTGNHHQYDGYPGYDGYASYAPQHDHEHYAYPRYKFEYGVHDPHTGDIKKQYEERDGDTVRGFYSLVEPDGSIRIVEYTADDKHGFQATVRKIGPSHHTPPTTHHPEENHHYHPHDVPYKPYDNHHYPHYPHHEVSNYFPAHYPQPYPHQGDEEEEGYGYNNYEHLNHGVYPNPYGYGDQNNAYYHYGLGGQEYEENEDYPYHANVNYPTYILPQNTYSTIQDLTAYGGSLDDSENPDKFYDKRSPVKKLDTTHFVQIGDKVKHQREPKKLDNTKVKEEKHPEVKISTTETNPSSRSHDTKKSN